MGVKPGAGEYRLRMIQNRVAEKIIVEEENPADR